MGLTPYSCPRMVDRGRQLVSSAAERGSGGFPAPGSGCGEMGGVVGRRTPHHTPYTDRSDADGKRGTFDSAGLSPPTSVITRASDSRDPA